MSSKQGDTPLMMATKKKTIEIVNLLLDRGADVSSRNKVFLYEQLNYFNCKFRIQE